MPRMQKILKTLIYTNIIAEILRTIPRSIPMDTIKYQEYR